MRLFCIIALCSWIPTYAQQQEDLIQDTMLNLPYTQMIHDIKSVPLSSEPFEMDDTIPPTIYLTFDDGPQKGTKIVADLVASEKIPVTFFMVGLHLELASPELMKTYRQVKSGAFTQILNHSYTHAYRNQYVAYYKDVAGAVADIEKSQAFLKPNKKIVRLPGSNVWRMPQGKRETKYHLRENVSDSLVSLGYSILGWDGEWHFNYYNLALRETHEQIAELIDKTIKAKRAMHHNHFVLLMHERSFSTKAGREELKALIRLLKKRQYRFAFASNYPMLNKDAIDKKNEEIKQKDISATAGVSF